MLQGADYTKRHSQRVDKLSRQAANINERWSLGLFPCALWARPIRLCVNITLAEFKTALLPEGLRNNWDRRLWFAGGAGWLVFL